MDYFLNLDGIPSPYQQNQEDSYPCGLPTISYPQYYQESEGNGLFDRLEMQPAIGGVSECPQRNIQDDMFDVDQDEQPESDQRNIVEAGAFIIEFHGIGGAANY